MSEAKLLQVGHRYFPGVDKMSVENFAIAKMNSLVATKCTPPYLLCYTQTEWTSDHDGSPLIRLESLVLELSETGINSINDAVEKYRETAKEADADVPGAEDWLSDWHDAIAEAVLDTWPVL